jgi:hypothetical protein
MGLITALMNNVRERRQAELAFALNQREEAEARGRSEQAENARMWQMLDPNQFGQSLNEAFAGKGGGDMGMPPMPASAYRDLPPMVGSAPRQAAPMAPEPPPMQQADGQPGPNAWSRILGKMKETSSRMGDNMSKGILNRASSPDTRVR